MKKILIADDEPFVRLLLNRSLRYLEEFNDVSILSAEDGEKALELAKTECPDLIFLDIMMPKMNGFDVCKKIKNDPLLEKTYIIFLTAKGQTSDREMGKRAGVDEYITKPFDPDEIAKKAAEILKVKPDTLSVGSD